MQKKSPVKSAAKPLVKSERGARKVSAKLPATKMAMAKAAPTRTKAAPAKNSPSREEIARRAYEIYMGRGQAPGREGEDWAQAERELVAEAHRNN